MNFEQITIRLGVDASAVTSGLTRIGSYIKGWAGSIVHHLKSDLGHLLVGAGIIETFRRLEERILAINRVSKETGASTNFVQSIMRVAAESGIGFESMAAGLARFNKQLGAAKMGETDVIKKLTDMHVITGKTSAQTINFTGAIHNLAVRFDQLNDKQKQAYLLSQAFGKGYAELMPIFEGGAAAVDKMSGGNFFTRISESSIKNIQATHAFLSASGNVAVSTTANVIFGLGKKLSTASILLATLIKNPHDAFFNGPGIDQKLSENIKKWEQHIDKERVESELQAEADKDGITVEEKKIQLLRQETELKEKSAELSAQIADRDKLSVDEMASKARKYTGNRDPLDAFHTVTPRMMAALGIKNLEQRARVQFLLGNDAKSNALQGEADKLRANSPWMKRMDQNPMQKTELELEKVNSQLIPISAAAKLIKE